jgi:hypothetical protein
MAGSGLAMTENAEHVEFVDGQRRDSDVPTSSLEPRGLRGGHAPLCPLKGNSELAARHCFSIPAFLISFSHSTS